LPRRRLIALALPFALLTVGCSSLSLGPFDALLGTGALDEATVAAGLRDALDTGTARATRKLSQPGAFSDDGRFRIELPSELDPMRQALGLAGMGQLFDDLEISMNRAAENASGEAVDVFVTAIANMSISDAFEILQGPDDAATRYFERVTSDRLRSRFEPVIKETMEDVGVYASYSALRARYDAIPFTKPPAPNLERYLTDRTLSALFSVLAEEEANIREDPAARTSALLRKVFGSPEAQPRPGA
jgi:hypothetical protein